MTISRYLLDANSCIAYLNGTSQAVIRQISRRLPLDISICHVVKAELLYGAYHSGRVDENLAVLDRFFDEFETLPFDDEVADIYAQIRHDLTSKGTPIGGNDLFIAATAMRHNVTLVTNNVREFTRVAGLRYENWHE